MVVKLQTRTYNLAKHEQKDLKRIEGSTYILRLDRPQWYGQVNFMDELKITTYILRMADNVRRLGQLYRWIRYNHIHPKNE
jgi:hypothetical protein